MSIPVSKPYIPENAYRYLKECLDTGWLSSQGPFVERFEDAFAKYHTMRHAISTTSGTTAIHLALAAAGITDCDEVIVPAFTMIAPVFAILYTSATPVLIDSDIDTWTINTKLIEKKITKKTKAIIAVHIYGHPVDMSPVHALAKKYNLIVIEDAAEGLGALYKNKKAGTLSDIGCFSFYANKLITTGEGGMVVTNNDDYAKKIRSLKDMAHSSEKRFVHTELAYNYRFTNLQAAVGLAYLEKIDEYNEKKRSVARHYSELLKENSLITCPVEKSWAQSSFWMYGILIDTKRISKLKFMKLLSEKGIETRDFFISMHRQPALIDRGLFHREKYPVADKIAEQGLYLPSGPNIQPEEIEYICDTIQSISKTV